MKLSHTTKTIVFVAMVSLSTGRPPLRGGGPALTTNVNTDRNLHSELGSNLENVVAYYDPEADIKCWMIYSVKHGNTGRSKSSKSKHKSMHGSKSSKSKSKSMHKSGSHHPKIEYRVDFSDIKIDSHAGKVTCTKSEAPEGEVALPVQAVLKLNKAFWENEVVRDVDVSWTKDNELEVTIKKFENWAAKYDPNGNPKCSLKYKFGGHSTNIAFHDDEIEVDGNEVYCFRNDVKHILPTDKGLDKLEKDIPNEDVEWIDYDVTDADVKWSDDMPIVLRIKGEPVNNDPTTEDDFEELNLTYDDSEGVVTFKYRPNGGHKDVLQFSEDEVTEDGLNVHFSGCREPPHDLKLPVEIEFDVFEQVKWETRCPGEDREDAKLVVLDEAGFTWTYDDTCGHSEKGHGRHLRDKARAKGDIKRKGS